MAKALGMYRPTVLSVAMGEVTRAVSLYLPFDGVLITHTYLASSYLEIDNSEDEEGHEAESGMPQLGHGGEGTELVPKMIEALAGKNVIG